MSWVSSLHNPIRPPPPWKRTLHVPLTIECQPLVIPMYVTYLACYHAPKVGTLIQIFFRFHWRGRMMHESRVSRHSKRWDAPIYTLMTDQKSVNDVHTWATWEKHRLVSIQGSNYQGTWIWVVMRLAVDLKQTPKLHIMFERDWTTCSKYANHSKLNYCTCSGREEETHIQSLNEHENLHFDNELDIYMSSENHKTVMTTVWILLVMSH